MTQTATLLTGILVLAALVESLVEYLVRPLVKPWLEVRLAPCLPHVPREAPRPPAGGVPRASRFAPPATGHALSSYHLNTSWGGVDNRFAKKHGYRPHPFHLPSSVVHRLPRCLASPSALACTGSGALPLAACRTARCC
jgi:hypothetical protein